MCKISENQNFIIFANFQIPKPVDGRNSYYVLNPGGDLDKTQERLSAFMQRFQWRGVVGEAIFL